jgi:hypothetical protein
MDTLSSAPGNASSLSAQSLTVTAELNTSFEDEQPAIRRDGLEMFFVSNRHDPSTGWVRAQWA